MKDVFISDSIVYVGVDDKNIDLFESQYVVPNGVSYNSYVILDDKITIMDTVDRRGTEGWLANLKETLGDKKPYYVVVSHLEPDHAGNLKTLLDLYPDIKVIGNPKTFTMIAQFFDVDLSDDRKVVVGEGDTVNLGTHTLQFFMAPLVHWPEVMVAYEQSEKILFSADGIADGSIPNTEIKAVISNNKNAYALQRAKDHNIAAACVSPKDFADRTAFNQALLEKIQSCEPDLIVLAGCLVVIPEIMVDAYPNKIINIHPSLIPAFCGTGYYGLKVHEGVLKRGVKVTGATVHFVDKGTDTGPIIIQKAVEVQQDDTPEILQRRVMEQAEWKIMPQAIRLIAEGKVRVENGKTIITE